MSSLTALTARRIALADLVAAAKFGTATPIHDPRRERRLLRRVTDLSRVHGLDPAFGRRFFRAQIEANKFVQRGLYALWTRHPVHRPSVRPDLATEVRPVLDRITHELVAALAGGPTRCAVTGPTEVTGDPVELMHRAALSIALAPLSTWENARTCRPRTRRP